MLDELCNVTVALLEDTMGPDKVAELLNAPDKELVERFAPRPAHIESAPPIPAGIHPAFPDEATEALVGAKLGASDAALMSMFSMPPAED